MCGVCGCGTNTNNKSVDEDPMVVRQTLESSLIPIQEKIFTGNDKIAEHNREHFERDNILAINLVSSPGSGKTTLLEQTLKLMRDENAFVIEGDQETQRDAIRLRQFGHPVVQVNTGEGCHLDADLVHQALHKLELKKKSLLFIENVGNLVCPSMFDLGETLRGVVASVTEGDDKPYKYPHIFRTSQVLILNKMDLLPYVPFNVESFITAVLEINPTIEIIKTSALSEDGISDWMQYLARKLN